MISPGVLRQPDWCWNNCPRAYRASGFVADWVPANPKLALLFSRPEKDDISERLPLSSGYGRYFWATLGRQAGLRKEMTILSHVLRCYSPAYPTGAESLRAEKACRYWDSLVNIKGLPQAAPPQQLSLREFNPNIFLVTFDLPSMITTGAFAALAAEDIRKAMRFVREGRRPLVLFGPEATFAVAPWLKGSGGVKNWRGHWWEGSFQTAETQPTCAKPTYNKPITSEELRRLRVPRKLVDKDFDFGQGDLFPPEKLS